MKYHFKDIENGQIAEGYITLQIENHEAEVDSADPEAILLAEKHGGELMKETKSKKLTPDPSTPTPTKEA